MNHVRLADLPWVEWTSPSGKFRGAGQQISEALGAAGPAANAAGRQPFDLELGRLEPGKAGCPFHRHAAQWELFLILRGTGRVRFGRHERDIGAGEAVLHPPGEAHQLINTGSEELHYYLVADNPTLDVCEYPDSGKWGISGSGTFERKNVHYYLREDDVPGETDRPDPRPASDRSSAPGARFLRLEDLSWEERRSPKGHYASFCRDLSLALGGRRNQGPEQGGHPFDVQIRRVPAGRAICPFHSHQAQWELFVVQHGRGEVRCGAERRRVEAGDVFLHPPGTPHQTRAAADAELEVMIIANNPALDVFHYPDSNKWGIRPPERQYFRVEPVDYFDGEE